MAPSRCRWASSAQMASASGEPPTTTSRSCGSDSTLAISDVAVTSWMLSASVTQRTGSGLPSAGRAVGVGPPPVLGLPRIVDPRGHPRWRVAAGGPAGVGDVAELPGPGQVGRHVGRHHVERQHLEPVAPQHQGPDGAGLLQIADHDPRPDVAGELGQRMVGVLDQDGQHRPPGQVVGQPAQQRHRLVGEPDQHHRRPGEPDDQPVQLSPEQGGHDAQGGDHQQHRTEQPGDLEPQRIGPAVGALADEGGGAAQQQAEGDGQRREERTLLLGAVPRAHHPEHDGASRRGRR